MSDSGKLSTYDQKIIQEGEYDTQNRHIKFSYNLNLRSLGFVNYINIHKLEIIQCFYIDPTLRSDTIIQLKMYCCSRQSMDGFQLDNLEVLDLEHNFPLGLQSLPDYPKLKQLSLVGCNINDISCISHFTLLTKLNVSENKIKILKLPETLTNLEDLTFSDNMTINISQLNLFVKLKKLNITQNRIKNISVLSNLVNLKELNISNNKIAVISHLKNLTQLINLNMSQNNILNIKILKNLVNLEELDLSCNRCSDITLLQHLCKLTKLQIRNNNIIDIRPLIQLTNLQNLDLSENQYIDLAPIQQFSNLKSLYLRNCNLYEISALIPLVNLEELDLSCNRCPDITLLQHLCKLTKLFICENNILDIRSLSKLTNLQILDLSENQYIDITPIQYLINIKSLFLSNCNLYEISTLRPLINLEELKINENQIIYVQPLKGKCLKYLDCCIDNNMILDPTQIHFHNLSHSYILAQHITYEFLSKNQRQVTKEQMNIANKMQIIDTTTTLLRNCQRKKARVKNNNLHIKKQQISPNLQYIQYILMQFTRKVVQFFESQNSFSQFE
ncbi:Leucine_rich repeats-containing protein [Hexamita inflata]|uniref:Leucine rich repeats-containing protein n=1 Tax=Hexamita inflata TaxID=28002 RepID=A0AA86P603_9EUKA|nr:Leucine rich repeats-containing protein [Hexamita inflata]